MKALRSPRFNAAIRDPRNAEAYRLFRSALMQDSARLFGSSVTIADADKCPRDELGRPMVRMIVSEHGKDKLMTLRVGRSVTFLGGVGAKDNQGKEAKPSLLSRVRQRLGI